MDCKSNGMAWVNKLYQKTETFLTEMDDLIPQESLRYVENQLLTAGESVKHFCSGLIQNVLDMGKEEVISSAPEVIEKSGGLASQMLSLDLDGHEQGSCIYDTSVQERIYDTSVRELSGESVDQNHNDSPFKKQNDAGMNMGIEENAKAETLFPSEIREIIASTNENSNYISVFSGVSQPNTEGTDGQVNLSAEVAIEFQKNLSICTESREMNNAMDVTKKVSPLHATVHSNIFSDAHEHGHLDVGLGSSDSGLSTISDDSDAHLQSEVEPHNTSDDSPTLSFSDGPTAEEDRSNPFTKEGTSTTSPISKLKLGESCIFVDCNETCSASEYEADHLHHQKYFSRAFSSMLKFAKEQKHKKATFFDDLKESNESTDHDFFESEWEII